MSTKTKVVAHRNQKLVLLLSGTSKTGSVGTYGEFPLCSATFLNLVKYRGGEGWCKVIEGEGGGGSWGDTTQV